MTAYTRVLFPQYFDGKDPPYRVTVKQNDSIYFFCLSFYERVCHSCLSVCPHTLVLFLPGHAREAFDFPIDSRPVYVDPLRRLSLSESAV